MTPDNVEPLYTTQLGAGLGLVEETRLLLSLYHPEMTTTQLYQEALNSGLFPMISARRLRNIIAECFSPRYLRPNVAIYLKPVAEVVSWQSLSQLLLIHTALANKVLQDFITSLYWEKYSGNYDTISTEDAYDFVYQAVAEGKTQKPWSDSTIKRVASYLLGCCAAYQLLSTGRVSKRTIQPVRIQSTTSLYLAYWLHFSGLGDNTLVNHNIWKLFGLDPLDVREELKTLAKNGWLIVQSAGEVTRISWQFQSMEEVVNVIIES
ncbi:DUF1819 family protein [Endozoicomonas sp. SESOKO4]|uniref:DUF1819 family protein n=1 Tax=Endozoicomonas sp. SESOKO4 TaxID=2828745 RepID=UPI002147527E|nr:DUF1819 family protein [Endozoicomonas sp. SESOKO4]